MCIFSSKGSSGGRSSRSCSSSSSSSSKRRASSLAYDASEDLDIFERYCCGRGGPGTDVGDDSFQEVSERTGSRGVSSRVLGQISPIRRVRPNDAPFLSTELPVSNIRPPLPARPLTAPPLQSQSSKVMSLTVNRPVYPVNHSDSQSTVVQTHSSTALRHTQVSLTACSSPQAHTNLGVAVRVVTHTNKESKLAVEAVVTKDTGHGLISPDIASSVAVQQTAASASWDQELLELEALERAEKGC
jgi:hypothetical protein